jgi:large subunit ribosomal protein L30
LGLKKLNHTVELDNTPEVKGMISAVNYLLRVEN